MAPFFNRVVSFYLAGPGAFLLDRKQQEIRSYFVGGYCHFSFSFATN